MADMLTNIGLSIGLVWAVTFVLGTYANAFQADRHHPQISHQYMAIIAGVASIVLLAFPALFLLVGQWL